MDANKKNALGMIETRGLLPLVEATDAALKAANVTLMSYTLVGGALAASFLVGDVGAMRAALSAAEGAMKRLEAQGVTHVIPRLAEEVWDILPKAPFPAPNGEPTGSPGGGEAEKPVARADNAMAVKGQSEAPALRAEAGPLAVKPPSHVPALKNSAPAPMVKTPASVQEKAAPAKKDAASPPAEKAKSSPPVKKAESPPPVKNAPAKPAAKPKGKPKGGAKKPKR